MPMLTDAREALWQAIDTWPALEDAFARKYKFDDRPGQVAGQPSPTIGDLPALAISLDAVGTEWTLHQSQQVRAKFKATIWTREWDVRPIEGFWEELVKAIYQGMDVPDSGRRVLSVMPMSQNRVVLGPGKDGPLATQWTFTIELLVGHWNPKN